MPLEMIPRTVEYYYLLRHLVAGSVVKARDRLWTVERFDWSKGRFSAPVWVAGYTPQGKLERLVVRLPEITDVMVPVDHQIPGGQIDPCFIDQVPPHG